MTNLYQDTLSSRDSDEELYMVPIDRLEAYAPKVVPFMERVLEKNGDEDFTIESVFSQLFNGKATLWVVMDKEPEVTGIMVTELVNRNDTRCLRLWLSCGKLFHHNMKFLREIELWGLRNFNATIVEALVRPGFVKYAEDYGFVAKQRRIVRHIPEAIH